MTLTEAGSDLINSQKVLDIAEIAQSFSKGDIRRPLLLPAILASVGSMKLQDLHNLTGYNKRSIPIYIEKLKDELGVVIGHEQEGQSRLAVLDWGPIVKKAGVVGLLNKDEQTAET
ncbi:hypothetical protein [Marinobacterium stanieri]|uniref:Uncharacterized protein n=1 Tax=Marinobacterium stanieri TaxID=49186 RepID=A0A1N6XKN4_9GAMM|nr:hypothetical protein [Marinobacterium stanieri]SIR02789.1 hypothetical protein SAMN05421647_11474 [Marinobacterium stanieri]